MVGYKIYITDYIVQLLYCYIVAKRRTIIVFIAIQQFNNITMV